MYGTDIEVHCVGGDLAVEGPAHVGDAEHEKGKAGVLVEEGFPEAADGGALEVVGGIGIEGGEELLDVVLTELYGHALRAKGRNVERKHWLGGGRTVANLAHRDGEMVQLRPLAVDEARKVRVIHRSAMLKNQRARGV